MEFTFGPFGGPALPVSFGAGFSSQNIGNTRILGAEGLIGVEGKVKGLRYQYSRWLHVHRC
jgi:hypothetical protein